jgi:dTDP-4-amino-4,6-dideoxygalactose transaminase
MYRAPDAVAAFGRAQLEMLDRNLASMKANAAVLAAALKATPHLLLPEAREPEGPNWYNYTLRFDMKALGHEHDAGAFRHRIVKALVAEGVDTSVWQDFSLPDMTVFRARNAYGHGCPWSCPHSRQFEYDREAYPMARRHADWHTGMTTPIRHPNGPRQAELTAKGIRKVMEHIGDIP